MMDLMALANALWYYWRRSNWVLYPPRFSRRLGAVRISGPIFLVGNQGDGLSLVSRMLRRHPLCCSITGDHTYWAGADEMQNVARCRLPRSLRLGGRFLCRDVPHRRLTSPRSWSYASDALIESYRKTDVDYSSEAARTLGNIIREAMHRHGDGEPKSRFVDKSQVFTVKMSYVDALLKDANPYFVLITRNPYAACYRAAKGKAGDMRRYAAFMSLNERMELCVQHWSNAMQSVLDDKDKVSNFMAVRFEDVLREPALALDELCDFLSLPFLEDMVPKEDQHLPFGSRYPDRWYPLRPDVNRPYLEEIPHPYVAMVEERCQTIADLFGYSPPRAHSIQVRSIDETGRSELSHG